MRYWGGGACTLGLMGQPNALCCHGVREEGKNIFGETLSECTHSLDPHSHPGKEPSALCQELGHRAA